MRADMRDRLKQMLVRHEGLNQALYRDSLGNLTIGIGYNISSRGLPMELIHLLCDMDCDYHWLALHQYDWFKSLSEPRQLALMDMRYQLGDQRFESFKRMLAALGQRDYELAAIEMLDSKYARQVPARAHYLASVMRSGKL